jgi:hypothetical protein
MVAGAGQWSFFVNSCNDGGSEDAGGCMNTRRDKRTQPHIGCKERHMLICRFDVSSLGEELVDEAEPAEGCRMMKDARAMLRRGSGKGAGEDSCGGK